MSPLFMDTGHEPNTPSSLSAEDSNSHTAGSEREGEGQQLQNPGTKRREKNRDAARKSRKKQTERADELHEELQCLEQSNSALKKEIATLKKDLHFYTTVLEHHEPYCRLRASAPNSSSSTSADCQTSSSPPRSPPQASSSALLTAPSISTSLSSSLALDCVENTHLSPSAPTTTTLASKSGSSTELFINSSSSPVTVPYSLSFSMLPAPHSLFSEGPPITSRPTDVTTVSTSCVANPFHSNTHSVAPQPQSVQDELHETSSVDFSTLHSDTLDSFAVKESFFVTASSYAGPLYSHVETENVGEAQSCCVNTRLYSGSPNDSSSLLPATLQEPALQSLAVSPQTRLEPFSAPSCALRPSCNQQMTTNPVSLLSLLTVPSPPTISQTTSNTFDELIAQSSDLQPPLGDPSKYLSLSELLEVNDWILNGNNNQ